MSNAEGSQQRTAGTILIAEDEMLLLMVMTEVLEDAGYEVLSAGDGAAALEILKTDQSIDLLITDVRMPRLTGYQLTEAGLQLRPDMKVVLMTGYAPEGIPASIQKSVATVMQKPLDLDTLPMVAEKIIANAL